ncbi:MAG: hypothetical protein IT264_09975 [Saprospiraceae bacterium]|nr:hypothetical protein [Saprospiraceae bacterium]HRG32624.1 hypothetical protein [Saprospiraceae bacterium]
MKNTFLIINFFYLLTACLYAQVKIILVVNKNDQDPLSGALHFNIGVGWRQKNLRLV